MQFTWDKEKEQRNFRKHGVWFDEAKTIWADLYAVEFFDQLHSDSEERFLKIGFSLKGRVLLVVFCERHRIDAIRIISARCATNSERNFYEERIRS